MDNAIVEMIARYGLAAIFLAVFLEYACFPVPSEIVLPLSGAVAAQGGIPFFTVYLVCIGAGLAGSLLDYGLARWGGEKALQKLGSRFPKFAGGVEAARLKFERYAALSAGLCRMVPLCRTVSYTHLVFRWRRFLFARGEGVFAKHSKRGYDRLSYGAHGI